MSLDYTCCRTLAKVGLPTDLVLSSDFTSSEAIQRSYCGSAKEWMVQGAIFYITAAATEDGHVVRLQKSNSSGSFASATDIGSVTINSSDVAGTKKVINVATADGVLTANQLVRITFDTAGVDATLGVDCEIFGNSSI
jgi:hypothetical protein